MGNDYGLQTAITAVQNKNAGTTLGSRSLFNLVDSIANLIVNPVITLLFAAALIYFLVGVVEYIRYADNENKRSEGSKRIFWGLIGMLVMISVFAIVALIKNTIGVR